MPTIGEPACKPAATPLLLTDRPHPRLTLALTIVLSLGVLVAALLGPAQTLAQTRKISCPSAATRAKAKHEGRACTQSSSKGKGNAKRRGKHGLKKTKAGSTGSAALAAVCEDGSAPTRGTGSEFSCTDGSEPTCEDGTTPMASRNGKSLICPAAGESESSTAEAECEDEGLECTGIGDGSDEQSCEASASESSSFVCEAES
jgi:hypothetical protein